jgi:hypothetical protein
MIEQYRELARPLTKNARELELKAAGNRVSQIQLSNKRAVPFD